MIKLIAIDLDGTLLTDDKRISDKTRLMLSRAVDCGVEILICTGRSYSDVVSMINRYDLDCNYILSSGAEIHDNNFNIIEQINMTEESISKIYDISKKYNVDVRFCSNDYNYIVGNEEDKLEIITRGLKLFHVGDYDEFIKSDFFRELCEKTLMVNRIEDIQNKIFKVFASGADINELELMAAEIDKLMDVASASSFRTNIEVTHANAQKGIALKKYALSHGYNMSEVMAIGDSMNDYSMLSMDFGSTVAMANADERIKDVAKYITLLNENDGVAYSICRVLSDNEA